MPPQKDAAMMPSQLKKLIKQLPERQRVTDGIKPTRIGHRSQKQHWLDWLKDHESGPGYYGRATFGHDARFIYNRLGCAPMLLWLIEAAGFNADILSPAIRRKPGRSVCAALRQAVPWDKLEAQLQVRCGTSRPSRSSKALAGRKGNT